MRLLGLVQLDAQSDVAAVVRKLVSHCQICRSYRVEIHEPDREPFVLYTREQETLLEKLPRFRLWRAQEYQTVVALHACDVNHDAVSSPEACSSPEAKTLRGFAVRLHRRKLATRLQRHHASLCIQPILEVLADRTSSGGAHFSDSMLSQVGTWVLPPDRLQIATHKA